MQKFLLATAIGAVVLTGCAKENTQTTPTAPVKAEHIKDGKPHHHPHGHAHGHHHAHMDKKGHGYHGTHPHFYVCEKDTKLVAHPSTESDVIKINITAPSLKLNNQTIELKQVSAGSGERYINDANPASIYEWHADGHNGIFSVNVNGTNYDYRCEIKPAKRH